MTWENEEIPEELKMFAGKTLRQVFEPHFSTEQFEALAGVISGFIDFGVQIPEFAKQASRQWWKYFVNRPLDLDNSPRDFGVVAKIIESYGQPRSLTARGQFQESFRKAAPKLVELVEKHFASSTDEEKAQFYAGRVEGKDLLGKFNSDFLKMVKRAPLYLAIAAKWRRFESFSSQAEAERWLRDEKLIEGSLNSTEVRAVFRTVGLRYRGPGRPRKSKM